MVKVKIVHGFWKRDDGNRIELLVSPPLTCLWPEIDS
jgi:hypothetical protein